jgi:hypothetical protein
LTSDLRIRTGISQAATVVSCSTASVTFRPARHSSLSQRRFWSSWHDRSHRPFRITVADLGATLEFHERVLGFTPKLQKGRPAALLFGEQKINVHRADRTFDQLCR